MKERRGRKCASCTDEDKMAGFMKSLKRTFMSELVKKADLRVDEVYVRLSMRLRRDKVTREKYVVLGLVAAMNYKHAELSVDEFRQFLDAARSMQQAMGIPEALPPLKS
ncbi:MAG: hypothetical protein AB7I34_25425 [Rhizobiaceae bacterium]